jgi:hypothetical protein
MLSHCIRPFTWHWFDIVALRETTLIVCSSNGSIASAQPWAVTAGKEATRVALCAAGLRLFSVCMGRGKNGGNRLRMGNIAKAETAYTGTAKGD